MGHGNTIYNSMSDFPASHVRSYQRQKKSDLCIQILCEYLSRAVEHLHQETAIAAIIRLQQFSILEHGTLR